MVSLVIEVEEELWDHDKLRAECWRLLNLHGVSINLNSKVGLKADEASLPPANHTIVACYASNNVVLKGVLGVEFTSQDLQFELCEKPVFRLPQQFWGKSCVIMDGPFMCIDPISDADPSLFVMGNVEHAIHTSNIGEKPETLSDLKLLLNQGIIPGVMRQKVIEVCKEISMEVQECPLSPQVLHRADEVILTNAISGMKWVGAYRGKRYFNKVSKMLLEKLNEKASSKSGQQETLPSPQN